MKLLASIAFSGSLLVAACGGSDRQAESPEGEMSTESGSTDSNSSGTDATDAGSTTPASEDAEPASSGDGTGTGTGAGTGTGTGGGPGPASGSGWESSLDKSGGTTPGFDAKILDRRFERGGDLRDAKSMISARSEHAGKEGSK
jgi:hypothetical protein